MSKASTLNHQSLFSFKRPGAQTKNPTEEEEVKSEDDVESQRREFEYYNELKSMKKGMAAINTSKT